jgi:hypothetical protein
LAEHALSAHFAPEIAAPWNVRAAPRGTQDARPVHPLRRESLRKKAFAQQCRRKYCLPKRAHVLFSAPILFARRK